MSLASEKRFLNTQILETEYLLSLVKSDPLMSYSLEQKVQELKDDLSKLPDDLKEAKVTLLFSGKAVKGSSGIKTTFISKTLRPFQELVKTQSALVRNGKVGKRGKQKSASNSELYLTALPRGSFGVELQQIDPNSFFGEEEVATAISQVMDLVEAATKDDNSFEEVIEKTPLRNLNNLRSFLKNIDDEHSILKMESGTQEINISREDIHKGYERVNGAVKEDFEIFVDGYLKGVFLESSKFEFTDVNGYKFTGLISPKISEDKIETYFNGFCRVHLLKSNTKFNSGREKTTYEMLDVMEAPKEEKADQA